MRISVEQNLLFVLLTNGELINNCPLKASDFTNKTDQMIFQAMLDVTTANQPIDIITIGENLEQKYRTVDMSYLGQLIEKGVGVASSFDSYVNIIRKSSRKRLAKQIAYTLQLQLEENVDGDPVADAIQKLMAIDSVSQKHMHTMNDCMRGALEELERAFNTQGITGISTGLTDLDSSIGGYHDTDLYVIGARPAMGKTAFLLGSANACNVPHGIISAEQDHTQAGIRLISMNGSVNSQNLRSGQIDETEWPKISAAVTNLKKQEMYLNDEPGICITNLIRSAREWRYNHGIKILFVDYIQKIRGSNKRASKTEQVTEVTGALKNLARELRIPVVALAQVKRDVESRPDKMPLQGDLSDASEIEKEADCIITLYRDEVYNENTEYPGLADLNICKNRHGPIGLVRTKYVGKYFQFKDLNPSRELAA